MACHDIQHRCDRKKSEVGTVGPCCRGCGEPAPAMKENNRMKSDRFKQRIDKLNQIIYIYINCQRMMTRADSGQAKNAEDWNS